MYYITREETDDFLKEPKQVDRSVNFVTLIDAINELQNWGNKIVEEYQAKGQFDITQTYMENVLGQDIGAPDKEIYLMMMYHDEETGEDYKIPDIEKMAMQSVEEQKQEEEIEDY